MKVGIIVYSYTGNTLSVAKEIQKELKYKKVNVKINKIEVKLLGEKYDGNNVEITKFPKIDEYDFIIFASPVHAFCLSSTMKKYLHSIKSLKTKKIACFVTQYFPKPWMGGNNAIRQIEKLINIKDGGVLETSIVNWKSKKCTEQIDETVNKMVKFVR